MARAAGIALVVQALKDEGVDTARYFANGPMVSAITDPKA